LELKKLSLISVGGIAGSLSRWAISLWVVDPSFPWATLLVNYIGSILLTIIVVVAKNHPNPRWWWRPMLGTGFCGGFTTYSAFAVKIDQEIRNHNYHGVLSYALASLIGTFILVFITYEFLEKIAQKRRSA
jgi:CrcB protein